MSRPALKSDWAFEASDFRKHPIWMNVHGADEEAPWYERCDETTFRPWDGLEDSLNERLLLVPVHITLNDGRTFPGACYAGAAGGDPDRHASEEAQETAAVRDLQPRIFIDNSQSVSFWGGNTPISTEVRAVLYDALGEPSAIFPLSFKGQSDELTDVPRGVVNGFYHSSSSEEVVVSTDREAPPEPARPEPPLELYDKATDLLERMEYIPALKILEEISQYRGCDLFGGSDLLAELTQQSIAIHLRNEDNWAALTRVDELLKAQPLSWRLWRDKAAALRGLDRKKDATAAESKAELFKQIAETHFRPRVLLPE